ncbi:hypothetical protein COO60DRAFT_1617451, partial [Scenedesmus sp. NREL 46B-D3]
RVRTYYIVCNTAAATLLFNWGALLYWHTCLGHCGFCACWAGTLGCNLSLVGLAGARVMMIVGCFRLHPELYFLCYPCIPLLSCTYVHCSVPL